MGIRQALQDSQLSDKSKMITRITNDKILQNTQAKFIFGG